MTMTLWIITGVMAFGAITCWIGMYVAAERKLRKEIEKLDGDYVIDIYY